MTPAALSARKVLTASQLERRRHRGPRPSELGLAVVAGKLVELAGGAGGATLTAAMSLVRQAQAEVASPVWVTPRGATFYPPDAAAAGVCLAALPVVRVPDAATALLAADPLLRSGAFGLVVLDLLDPPRARERGAPASVWGRLQGLAHKHDAALVILTHKTGAMSSVSSMVSLRAQVSWAAGAGGEVELDIQVTKDKQHGPGWAQKERCRAAVGMR